MKKESMEKLKESLAEKYREKFGTLRGATLDNFISCIDEDLCDEVFANLKELSKDTTNMLNEAKHRANTIAVGMDEKISDVNLVMMAADQKMAELNQRIKDADSVSPIQNSSLAEMVYVYKDLANMEFDSYAMKLQNLQNASYFMWAWMMGERGMNQDTKTNPMKNGPVTSVKEETSKDDPDHYGWHDASVTDDWEKTKKGIRIH